MTADLHLWFDPVCPCSWSTSQFVRSVAAQRGYQVEWRFLSLRLLNRTVDYDAHLPPEAEGDHTAGLQLLRLAARVRAEHGLGAVGPLYAALGARLWDGPPADGDLPSRVSPLASASLRDCGLPQELAQALGDGAWDAGLQAETDEGVALAGEGAATPVLHVDPPDGVVLSGPLVSRLPDDDRAGELWDHVVALAGPGFSALRRSVPGLSVHTATLDTGRRR